MKPPRRQISDAEFERAAVEYDGLINYLARKYHIRGYDDDDMKQELLIILLKCMRYFDDSMGAVFTTYFTTAVHRWLNTRLIRSEHKLEVISFDNLDMPQEAFDMFECDEDVEFNVLIDDMAETVIEEVRQIRYGDLVLDVMYGHMSMSAAARIAGVSTQRIQQLCKGIADKLKEKLKEDIEYYDKVRATR